MHLGFSFLSTKSTLGSHLTSKSMSFEPPSQLHTQGFQSLEGEAVELTFQSLPRVWTHSSSALVGVVCQE